MSLHISRLIKAERNVTLFIESLHFLPLNMFDKCLFIGSNLQVRSWTAPNIRLLLSDHTQLSIDLNFLVNFDIQNRTTDQPSVLVLQTWVSKMEEAVTLAIATTFTFI